MLTPSTQSRNNRLSPIGLWHRLALVGIVVVGGVARFWSLGGQSYWYDESATVTLLHRGIVEMLAAITAREGTPPLYYVLAWPWSRLLGMQEAGLRSLSAVAGLATVLVGYAAAKQLARSTSAGLVTAALIAVNPLLVWYSQEARSYALLVLLTAVSLWSLILALDDPSTRRIAAWAGSALLALATHYFAVFVVIPQAVLLVLFLPQRRRATLTAVGMTALTGLALLPFVMTQRGNGHSGEWIRELDLRRRVVELLQEPLFGFSKPSLVGWLFALSGLAAAAVLLAFRANRRERRGASTSFALALSGVALPLIAAFASFDYVITRNVIGTVFPLLLGIAIPLASRRAGTLGLMGSAALCSVFAVSTVKDASDPAVKKIDWRSAAAAFGSPEQPRLIIATERSRPLRLYMRGIEPVRRRSIVVSEIDVIVSNSRPRGYSGCWSGAACNVPTLFLRRAPVPGFGVTEHRRIGPLELVRYRSAHPRAVLARPLATALLRAHRALRGRRGKPRPRPRVYFQPAVAQRGVKHSR